MKNGKLKISNKCVRCHECLKIISGCIYYNSIKGSNNMKNLKGVNKYLSVGVNANWIYDYFKNQNYEPGNRKTDVMFGLLTDANIIMKRTREFTDFGKFVKKRNLDDISWQLMLCNLVYTPAFNWYIKNIPFNETYYENRLLLDMGDDVKKKASEFWNSFKVILDSNKVFQDIGFGYPDITSKITKSGVEKKTLNFIEREPWRFPEPLVILYSLYKFSEACDGYYEFTLTRLLNHDIESEGISPTEIFGLDRDKMEQLLTGLSMNYHDFINATFTIDLDNITLRKDKKSSDVLTLFEGV
jgi:phosphoadenosine phosphosulfate reductase